LQIDQGLKLVGMGCVTLYWCRWKVQRKFYLGEKVRAGFSLGDVGTDKKISLIGF